MDSDSAGFDRLEKPEAAPAWDRFGHWKAWPARILLAVVAALLVLAALTPLTASMDGTPSDVPSLVGDNAPASPEEEERDEDLAFYDRVIERIEGGENYYDFIVPEQRARDYPVNPGLAVRLPTLAYIHAALGEPGMIVLSILLMVATIWAWWKRLGDEPGAARMRRIGAALMFMGASLGLNRYYFVLHELWAGMLVALAFGSIGPGAGAGRSPSPHWRWQSASTCFLMSCSWARWPPGGATGRKPQHGARWFSPSSPRWHGTCRWRTRRCSRATPKAPTGWCCAGSAAGSAMWC